MPSIMVAEMPGFLSQQGVAEKVSGQDKILVPAFAAEINGKGLRLKTATEFDPVANSDGSFSSLALGDDISWYAAHPSIPGTQPDIVFTKNSTYPTGYSADDSRKHGGFHFGRTRALADRYNDTATIVTEILENGVWCQKNRPWPADPAGMVKLPSGIWVDIYLASADGGAWPADKHLSKYGVNPLTGTEGYSYKDYIMLAGRSGKRLPSIAEWLEGAYGSPQGHDADNDAAWSYTSNTGRQVTGYVEQAVSCHGLVDCAGNVYEVLTEMRSEGGAWAWVTTLNTGKDSAYSHGQQYVDDYVRVFLGGGGWSDGAKAGAACLGSNNNLGSVGTNTGFRAVCDPLTSGN